jgi:hypothetical protein
LSGLARYLNIQACMTQHHDFNRLKQPKQANASKTFRQQQKPIASI